MHCGWSLFDYFVIHWNTTCIEFFFMFLEFFLSSDFDRLLFINCKLLAFSINLICQVVTLSICNNSHLMTKPAKWHVRQAKTQISLGIRPVWSVFAVRMKKHRVLSYPLSAQRRLIRLGGCPGWSESLLGTHSFSWFCHEAVHVFSFQTLFYQLHHWNRSLYISFFRHCLLGQKCLS